MSDFDKFKADFNKEQGVAKPPNGFILKGRYLKASGVKLPNRFFEYEDDYKRAYELDKFYREIEEAEEVFNKVILKPICDFMTKYLNMFIEWGKR